MKDIPKIIALILLLFSTVSCAQSWRKQGDSPFLQGIVLCEVNYDTGDFKSYQLAPEKMIRAGTSPLLKTKEILDLSLLSGMQYAYIVEGKKLIRVALGSPDTPASGHKTLELIVDLPPINATRLFTSFDGQKVAFLKPDKQKYFAIVVDLKRNHKSKFLLERPRVDSNEFVWSYDGKTLYYNSFDQNQRMYVRGLNLESGKTAVITDGGITAASFDGEEIYVYKDDSTAPGNSLTLYSPTKKRVLKIDKSFQGGPQIIIGNSKGETLSSTFSSNYKNFVIVYRKIGSNVEDLVLRTYDAKSFSLQLLIFRK